MVVEFVFYLFAAVAVVAALMVITARNPVQSVLFLVLTFFTVAAIFITLEAEFLAVLLVMVYMGAVAILFLFVVMLLDIDFAQLRREMVQHLPLGLVVGLVILVEMVVMVMGLHLDPAAVPATEVSNTLAIGRVLYTQFLYPFEIASIVLLVALIGAVVLTHRQRTGVKRQNIAEQIARRREDAVELKKVASGEGA